MWSELFRNLILPQLPVEMVDGKSLSFWLLRRTLGKAIVFGRIPDNLVYSDANINSRPLRYQSKITDVLVPLTPSMFVVQNSNSNITDIDDVDANQFLKRLTR